MYLKFARDYHGLKSFYVIIILMLLVSTSAFGYGIDGTKDSANFSNQMGPYPAYESWSYEGGNAIAPLADNFSGNNDSFSSYDSASLYYSSDGDIMTHSASDIGSTGWYKPFNSAYYTPSGTGGFTVEWRMKVNSMSGSDGLFMQFDCDEARQSYMRLKNDNTITAGGVTAAVADISQWHTYRIAVLGEDPGDPGAVKANIYQNANLIIEAFDAGIVGEASPSDYLWAQVEWDSQLGAYATETDYIRIDASGAYAPEMQEEYTLAVYTVGNGTISCDPNQGTYLYNDVVELTATADPCWTFNYWSGNLSGSTNPDTIVITGNTSVTAHFTPVEPIEEITVVSPTSPIPSILKGTGADTSDAAGELADYLSRVCGRTVPVFTNYGDLPDTGTVIHVGENSFTDSYAPEIAGLHSDGFIMKYVNILGSRDHIILAGNMDRSSLWAVEQFLKDYCGVRWLFPDPVYGEHVPSMPTITIDSSLDETHEPDYTSRANFGMYYFYPSWRQLRLRPIGSQHGNHALQYIFNNGSYSGEIFALHQEWFPWFNGQRNWWEYGNGWQICFANTETIDHAIQYCLDYFAANPNADTVSVGQNDGSGFCTDSLCTNFKSANGFTQSELYWWWVNQVAAQVKLTYPNKWVESLAYNWSSSPPGFALESNVAITKTFVLDGEIGQAEDWLDPPASCQSVNLYTYTYGRNFIGFRHYPTAMRDFLRWGRDTLGARAHITECGGDWTFDGPKYYSSQIFQWDADADPNAVMTEFCDVSYGSGSADMKNFWDRLEEVWERRGAIPYGASNMRWLFYQWVGWAEQCYVQPNDEFREYTLSDVAHLDTSIANAITLTAGDSNEVQYRVARMEEAWKYYRTYLLSKLNYLDVQPNTTVTSEASKQSVMDLAQEIADLRSDRNYYMGQMMSYSIVNPRLSNSSKFKLAWMTAYTTFSNELALIDEACTSISDYIKSNSSTASAIQYWEAVETANNLYKYAQTQVYMLNNPFLTDLLTNGGFEAGTLTGWSSGGSTGISSSGSHGGTYNARLMSGACYGGSTLSQTVSVSPQERYRLTVWSKYTSTPTSYYVPTEAVIEFYSGASYVSYGEPRRAMFRSFSAADGWTRLQSTVTVPPGADSAIITVRMTHSYEVRIDDVKFEKIKDAPPVTHGELADDFELLNLDASKWYPASDSGGALPPRMENGWMTYDSGAMYSINSYSTFDELMDYTGTDRYRLRMRVGLVEGGNSMAFGIKSGTGKISTSHNGVFYYHYFDFADTGKAMLSYFNYNNGSSGPSGSYYLPIAGPVTDVWYTFYYDPTNVTVYASVNGYKEDPANLVVQYAHGITDLTGQGSVYLKLATGLYKMDEISLLSPPKICGGLGTYYLDADLNPDCYVNLADVAVFISVWLDGGCDWPDWCDGADIDKSGEVDFADFAGLLTQWPECTDPTNGSCSP